MGHAVTVPEPPLPWEQRLQAERDRLRLLLEITNLLVSRHDLGELFEALSECIGRAIPHEYASVSLYESRGVAEARTWLVVLDGRRRRDLENRSFTVSADSTAQFANAPAIVYDITVLAANNPPVATVLAPQGLHSFCSVQLTTARGAFGILSVASRRSEPFGADDVRLLSEASRQIAIAVDNTLAYDEIRRLKDQLLSDKRYLEQEIRDDHGFEEIIGQSEPLRRTLRQVDTVSGTDATVLLLGETGTGKELVARAIHERSSRRAHTFVRVNCAALPASLLESEMFGHERGAFTNAIATRVGRFEVAHRGTLFLDEIGELPIDMQPKLLRAVQEREIERVGASTPIRVDVRLIGATNRDLAAMVQAGTFREDLFYRLNVFPIHLPSLRERRDDIPSLVAHFVRKHAARLRRVIETVPPATMDALVSWDWPGNIRELENVIERAVILATDGVLRVPLPAHTPVSAAASSSAPALSPSALTPLEQVQRDTILAALRAAEGVLGGAGGAAARLGMKRTTLQSRMRKLGIVRRGY
jgi:formate hydrogenlyase transcriptional activator